MPGVMESEVMTEKRQRGRPKTSQRTDRTARIDTKVLGWAEIVAKHDGVTVAELLTEILREPLRRRVGKIAKESLEEGA